MLVENKRYLFVYLGLGLFVHLGLRQDPIGSLELDNLIEILFARLAFDTDILMIDAKSSVKCLLPKLLVHTTFVNVALLLVSFCRVKTSWGEST